MKKKTNKIFALLFILSVCCFSFSQPNYQGINKTCGDISISSGTIPSLGTLRAGEEVVTLVNHVQKTAGNYSVIFNGTNLASGLYIYRIEAGSYTQSKKMLLIK